jgi:hypothetical protein
MLDKKDVLIILLFLMIIITLGITLSKINKFMPTWATCEDDINITARCGCVPCTWHNAEKYNGNNSCEGFDEFNNR